MPQSQYIADISSMSDVEQHNSTPELPHFNEGEHKEISLQFAEHNGMIQVGIMSSGMQDDVNEIALFLSFALEKLLDTDIR